MTPTKAAEDVLVELREKLRRFLPVSWNNETDGHGHPSHGVLTFGKHPTQAMSMQPDDWMVLNDLPDAITTLLERERILAEALRFEFGSLESATLAGAISLGPEARELHELARAALTREGEDADAA